jgi:hypothetical protein
MFLCGIPARSIRLVRSGSVQAKEKVKQAETSQDESDKSYSHIERNTLRLAVQFPFDRERC